MAQKLYGSEAALPLALVTVMVPAIILGLVLAVASLRAYDRSRLSAAG